VATREVLTEQFGVFFKTKDLLGMPIIVILVNVVYGVRCMVAIVNPIPIFGPIRIPIPSIDRTPNWLLRVGTYVG